MEQAEKNNNTTNQKDQDAAEVTAYSSSEFDLAFNVLDIEKTATFQEARKKYLFLVKEWTPEQFIINKVIYKFAKDKLDEINTAWKVVLRYYTENEAVSTSILAQSMDKEEEELLVNKETETKDQTATLPSVETQRQHLMPAELAENTVRDQAGVMTQQRKGGERWEPKKRLDVSSGPVMPVIQRKFIESNYVLATALIFIGILLILYIYKIKSDKDINNRYNYVGVKLDNFSTSTSKSTLINKVDPYNLHQATKTENKGVSPKPLNQYHGEVSVKKFAESGHKLVNPDKINNGKQITTKDPMNINNDEAEKAIRNYFMAVQEKRIDDALSMCTDNGKVVKAKSFKKIVIFTKGYRIESVVPISVYNDEALYKVMLWQDFYKEAAQYWEIKLQLLKQDDKWKIDSTDGKIAKSESVKDVRSKP
jgi:hypothetical protein